jgi:hypothetical protein
MEKRTDPYLALLIDTVLDTAMAMGIGLSVSSVVPLGVPVDVAVRVLAYPAQRRRSDAKHFTLPVQQAAERLNKLLRLRQYLPR